MSRSADADATFLSAPPALSADLHPNGDTAGTHKNQQTPTNTNKKKRNGHFYLQTIKVQKAENL